MTLRREKHPQWPARNTVARQFGTWHGALEAAGLAARAAATPDRFAARSRVTFEAGRVAQCERVLAPTQATVYNLFPGGWHAVLAALRGYP
jgi:hypothetical protein